MAQPGSPPPRSFEVPCRKVVLVVDRDPAALVATRRTLVTLPIRLLCVASAEEALEIVRVREPAALVSENDLPGMSGLELLARLRSAAPRVRGLLHTGDALARELAAHVGHATVAKDAPAEELRAAVGQLVSADEEERDREPLAGVPAATRDDRR